MGRSFDSPWILLLATLAILIASGMAASACNGDDDDDDDDNAIDDDDDAIDDDTDENPWVWTDPNAECESLAEQESYEPCRNCVIQCNLAGENQIDLSAGPCVAEQIVTGWACDIVHSPPNPVDDIVDNQCVQYPTLVPHIIQVTPLCRFVQAL